MRQFFGILLLFVIIITASAGSLNIDYIDRWSNIIGFAVIAASLALYFILVYTSIKLIMPKEI